jgi:hypothetical protein
MLSRVRDACHEETLQIYMCVYGVEVLGAMNGRLQLAGVQSWLVSWLQLRAST